jgi:hypothetical protein
MIKGKIENPSLEKEGGLRMGKKKERKFTDEEVSLLNAMVAAGVSILRNSLIFRERKEAR